MRIAALWKALQLLVAAKVCPCLVLHIFLYCFLQVSLIVIKSQCLFSRILSSLVSERVFLHHRDCDRFLMFAVESLRVVWIVVLCVGSCVVGRCWLSLCCEADRCISTYCSEVSCCSPLALSSWQGVVVFGVVLVELTGSCCRSISWTLAAQSVLAHRWTFKRDARRLSQPPSRCIRVTRLR